jgi:hypothetical protein
MLLAAALAWAPSARAQSSSSLGIAAGATVPLSSYADDKNTGYHLGLVFDLQTPWSPFSARIDGDFSELKYKGSSTKEQIWMATASFVARVPNATRVTPYVIGGLGVYNRHRTLVFGNTSSTHLGFNGGAGLRFGGANGYTFLEIRYHRAGAGPEPQNTSERRDIRMVPITFGVSF